ncbi:transcription factor LCR F1 [Echinococcus multilocularis]|uniref:Transcription factor LCR F1 n=1 Tax=Echinococcus multilocularis TaxID=6211 RepID=A0A068Y2P8_ECHMU|nr:transcription factor LCR F1 [Echinococcus multilocularis]
MNEKSSSPIKSFLSFLITREAVIFSTDFSIHLLQSLIRLYCAKLSFLCLLPLKRIAVAPPHSFQVRVLLTELYPDQGSLLGAAACRSNENLCIDDYLIYLQKIGFDDPEEGQIDELNFLFQANHLPISVFQSNAQNRDRESGACQTFLIPTTSTSGAGVKPGPVELDLAPHLVVSVKPERDDLLLTPQQTSSVEEVTFDTESSENMTDFTPRKLPVSKKVLGPFESTCSITSRTGAPSEYVALGPPPNNSVVRSLQRNTELESPPSTLFVTQASPSSSRVPIFVGPLTDAATLTRSALSPLPSTLSHNGVLKSLSNVRQTPQPRHHLHFSQDRFHQLRNQARRYMPENETFVWPRYDTPRHICIPGPCGSNSSEDLGHISDTEFCPWVSQTSNWRKKEEEGWDEEVDQSEGDEGEQDGYERWEEEGEIKFSRIVTFPSVPGSTPRSSFYDRNIRDINILKRLAVPFSYEEVAYSSNERFREIKSKPGLTFDQITAMLDARRRATNRQAAERCRRVKSAARDSLANQLDRLRLEHADLTRRIICTRRRRQQKWDELTSAQKHLLQNLVDSTGTPLDPSQWRIQTTSEGELILVRINVSGDINNRNNKDDRNDYHEETGNSAKLS